MVKHTVFAQVLQLIYRYNFGNAYIDYTWLYALTQQRIFFVTRTKSNIDYSVLGQHTQSKRKSVVADKKIRISGFYSQQQYPDVLRLVTYYNPETNKELMFLTNNFTLAVQTIDDLYKARWQIELFFKWIKQNLKIKTFLGTSNNAVMRQIWTAMTYYLLLSFIKFQTKYSYTVQELARIIKEMLMEHIRLLETLSMKFNDCQYIKYNNFQLAFI